jgi:N-acetylmuramoyl-L-alanine amidase
MQETIDTLARTIWGEARGEGAAGMQAVAAVILNRLSITKKSGGYWWGDNLIEICRKPYQFSCWNENDPNLKKLQAVDDRDLHFATALRLARRAVTTGLTDPTNGATHYHAAGITPYWSKNEKPCAVLGRHIFYKLKG